jgi:VRR-NUC domain
LPIRIQDHPELLKLLSPEDQKTYGPGIHPPDDPHPPAKTDKLEKDEQRSFANWLLLHELPFVWHSTAKRSTATPGTPDFIVGVNRVTLWIEFKREQAELSSDQEKFKALLERQKIRYYVCYTAFEAIQLLAQFAEPQLDLSGLFSDPDPKHEPPPSTAPETSHPAAPESGALQDA